MRSRLSSYPGIRGNVRENQSIGPGRSAATGKIQREPTRAAAAPGRLGPLPLLAAAVVCAALGLTALTYHPGHHPGHRTPPAVRPAAAAGPGPEAQAPAAPTSTVSVPTTTPAAPASGLTLLPSPGAGPADDLESDSAVQQLLDSDVPHDLDPADAAAAIAAAKAWLAADTTGPAPHVKASAAYRGTAADSATAVLIYSVPGDLQPSHRLVLAESDTFGVWTVLPPDHSGPQPTPR